MTSPMNQPSFNLGPGFWAGLPIPERQYLLERYRARATRVFGGLAVAPVAKPRLDVLVMAAVEAVHLFFTAALCEPTPDDLDAFFDHFITRSMNDTPNRIQADADTD